MSLLISAAVSAAKSLLLKMQIGKLWWYILFGVDKLCHALLIIILMSKAEHLQIHRAFDKD